jgi:exopolyphosphatase / guanosine-5'-triphosphate,3'-diphosphate pyrophosphatase
MSKRTAIIDIGSNSARLVIYEQSSRYGFRLICEQKSKVRIGEGAYNNGGFLQPIGIERAYNALNSFKQTIENYKAHKTICVATSALRDAPNSKEFIQMIKENLNLSIKVIDGKEEAFYGGIAVLNLLTKKDVITVDIGGGSSDITLIKNGKIEDAFSVNIGTVRLKELFFDNNSSIKDAKEFIQNELSLLPKKFQLDTIVAIGGSARTIADIIIKTSDYPLNKLHAFKYELKEYNDLLSRIISSDIKDLHNFSINQDRHDTIREGILIFLEIAKHIGARQVITSGVGVREGVFLSKFLKNSNLKFPNNINPSIQNILDRFDSCQGSKFDSKKRQTIKKLAEIFSSNFEIKKIFLFELQSAITMSEIGKNLTIYKAHKHSFYIALQELNYGFTHKQMILIAMLLKAGKKAKLKKYLYKRYKSILPNKITLKWHLFLYSLTLCIFEFSNDTKISFYFENNTLYIKSDQSLYLLKERLEEIEKPADFEIVIGNN